MVERESTLTMMPPSNLKARVVVPLANFTAWLESPPPQVEAKLVRQKCAGYEINVRGLDLDDQKRVYIIKECKQNNFKKYCVSYIGNIGYLESILVTNAVEKQGGRCVRNHVVVAVVITASMVEFARANVKNVIADY